jgi:hypothetical protein
MMEPLWTTSRNTEKLNRERQRLRAQVSTTLNEDDDPLGLRSVRDGLLRTMERMILSLDYWSCLTRPPENSRTTGHTGQTYGTLSCGRCMHARSNHTLLFLFMCFGLPMRLARGTRRCMRNMRVYLRWKDGG